MAEKKTIREALARVTMRLPQSLWDAVQHRAIDEHITLSELVVRALTRYLKGGNA
jgi:predicted DNA binding CopG/RHH family protein